MIEKFAKRIIELHGFSSNSLSGFSCYIPDTYQFSQNEGILIWNYSKAYSRFETQIQKFSAKARINRIKEMLNIDKLEYKSRLKEAINLYSDELLAIKCFSRIGNGVRLFNEYKIHNMGANFSCLKNDLIALRQFEIWTINNPIVKFAEHEGYFECLNKQSLAWDEFFNE